MKRCKRYCGVTCVDGSCPIANIEEYIERDYFVVRNCDDCPYYRGCDDCYFFDKPEICKIADRGYYYGR